jgi:hypothetical protein
MLSTNLSTRPFYNVRAVHSALGLLALLVVAVTVFNVVQVVRLTQAERTLGADAALDEQEAARVRAEAARMRAQIDPGAMTRLGASVDEANALIDRRTFSWTALLAQFETTLPRDVRVRRIQPREQRGRTFLVVVDLEAYDVADVSRFMAALEATAVFEQVRPIRYSPEAGLVRGSIEAVYLPPSLRGDAATGPGDARLARGAGAGGGTRP